MKVLYTSDHHLHHSGMEFSFGKMVETFEMPRRAEIISNEVRKAPWASIEQPGDYDLSHILRIHDPVYAEFLRTIFDEWVAAGRDGEVWPCGWRHRTMPALNRPPSGIDAKLSYYSYDLGGSITATTYRAARRAVDTAMAGAAAIVAGERGAFSLCRPPGHHAGSDSFGGYCYFNNAAIAAQNLLDNGFGKVAIIDVDYHHGNGTQQIFYGRNDVLTISIHGDPDFEFPFHMGYARERGAGAGEGFNVNYPLPAGTAWDVWSICLEQACRQSLAFGAQAIIIALGADTYEKDPISQFKLKTADFRKMGVRIARLGLPTLFVMEVGYAVDDLGLNVVNVLDGFVSAA